MILHQDALIVLDYDPTSDILAVNWPDIKNYTILEITHSFKQLISTIRHYDIKLLLIDARSHDISDAAGEEYQELVSDLNRGFTNTRVQKIALLQSSITSLEAAAQALRSDSDELVPAGVLHRNFTALTDALEWLKEKD